MFYRLDEGRSPVPCSIEEMPQKIADRRVALDQFGEKFVSTVFLGVDYGFDGKVLLFETATYAPDEGWDIIDRYATWEEAEVGHGCALEEAKARWL